MNWADAGRKKIEEREAELVAVGESVLDPDGREYEVVNLGNYKGALVTLYLQPKGQCGNRPFTFHRHEKIRVRR